MKGRALVTKGEDKHPGLAAEVPRLCSCGGLGSLHPVVVIPLPAGPLVIDVPAAACLSCATFTCPGQHVSRAASRDILEIIEESGISRRHLADAYHCWRPLGLESRDEEHL